MKVLNRVYLFLFFALIIGILILRYFLPASSPGAQFTKSDAMKLKAAVTERIRIAGFTAAYTEYLRSSGTYGIRMHVMDHFFGQYIYAAKGLDGLSSCNSAHGLGCEHSLFLAEMLKNPDPAETTLSDICSAYPRDSCFHALGHALLLTFPQKSINELSSVCAASGTVERTDECVNGVFMQHFMPALFLPDSSYPMLIPFEPSHAYDICPAVDAPYRSACTEEMVRWWDAATDSNFRKIAYLCGNLPHGLSEKDCFYTMGSEAAYLYRTDTRRVQSVCALPDTPGRRTVCTEGASSYTDMEGNGQVSPCTNSLPCPTGTDRMMQMN